MKRKQAEEDEAAERQHVANAQAARDAEVCFKLKLDLQFREEHEREKRAYEDFQRKDEAEEEPAYHEALYKRKEKMERKNQEYQEYRLAQGGGYVPIQPRINLRHLDIETLEHYHVPWEYDPVRCPHFYLELRGLIRQQTDSKFVILLRELDKYETDVLFEHTRRRRLDPGGPLIIEKADKADKTPNYAWVRRKSKDPSHGLRSTLSNAVVEEAKHTKVSTYNLIPTEKKCAKPSAKDAIKTNTKDLSNSFISREDDKDVEDLVREWTNLYQDDSSAPDNAPDEQASSRALGFESRTYSGPVVYYHPGSSLSSTVGAPVTRPRHAPRYVEVLPRSSSSSSSSTSR